MTSHKTGSTGTPRATAPPARTFGPRPDCEGHVRRCVLWKRVLSGC